MIEGRNEFSREAAAAEGEEFCDERLWLCDVERLDKSGLALAEIFR